MKNNIIFIINPIAGKGKGKIVASMIQQFFHKKNIHIQICFTEKSGHATDLTKQFISLKLNTIVACGGDGTINEVAQALVGTDIALGIIPIGSGNGLAANLHIPKSIDSALEIILKQKTKTIDAGKINHQYFFSNIGFGIDAAVIEQYAQTKKRNFLGYVFASTKALLQYKTKSFSVKIDDEKELKNDYYFLFCSNSNEAGYGISFSPKAKLNDGKLDFLAIKKLNFIQQIHFSICVLLKRIEKMNQAEMLQIRSAKFIAKNAKTIAQIDGEAFVLNEKNIEVSVVPNALHVIIP